MKSPIWVTRDMAMEGTPVAVHKWGNAGNAVAKKAEVDMSGDTSGGDISASDQL